MLSARLAAERPAGPGHDALQASSTLVTTAVTVREKNGRIVSNLTERDFVVDEDGRPQAIARFSSERTPMSVAIVLDASQSLRGDPMQVARAAVKRFVDTALRPDDEAALVTFNHTVSVVETWTTDRAKVRAGLDALVPAGSTAPYDAVFKTMSLFGTRGLQRAAMVVISDGGDSASEVTPARIKQLLAGTDVFLYWIATDHPEARSSSRINSYTIADLAAQANGYSEVIQATAELDAALTRVADELDHQYLLSYEPATPANGRFHSVRVSVPSKDYVVRARRGVQR
jgi:Ca-activated chloride channel family protein